MKRAFIICVMICSYYIIYAQNTISGKVICSDSVPLTGVNVYIPEINKGTITNNEGYYEIKNLPGSKIKIQFSHIGYTSTIKTIILLHDQTELNISLEESFIETEEIVVSGGYNSTQHENAVKIDVLSLSLQRISLTPNFTEALTKVPGVDMISKGIGVSKPVIRGLSMNNILVLNNGVRVENYQFSENHPLGIDDNSIDRVEIIKGPASLLYGSDAIGGVINFIKDKPAHTGSIVGNYQTQFYSNTFGLKNSLGIKGASQYIFAGIRINHKTHADYKQGGGTFVPNSRFKELSLLANTGYTGKNGTYKLYYDYLKQDLGMTVPPSISLIEKQGRKNNIWYQDLEHHIVSSQNNHYLGKFKWENNIAYQVALRKLQTTLSEPVIEMNLHTLTYESKLYLPSNKKSEYIVGIQGMNQINRNKNNRVSQFLPDADINNIGILSLIQHTIFNKLKLQGGIRFDLYKTETFALGSVSSGNYHAPVLKDFSSINGSFGTTYSVNKYLLLRFNLAKAYRVPNLSELTSNGAHGSRHETGNENLEPENALEYDVSMHFHKKNFTIDFAIFHNIIDNYIFISPTFDTTIKGLHIYKYTQGNSILYGFETGIHYHPKSIEWLHFETVYSSVTGKKSDGNYLPFIPADKMNIEIRAEKKKLYFLENAFISANTHTSLSQKHAAPDETITPGYLLLGIAVGGQIKLKKQNLLFVLSANNILDKKYTDHLSTLKDLSVYNLGRNISFSLNIPFKIK